MSNKKILFIAPAQAVTHLFPVLREMGVEVGIAENIKGASSFIRKSTPDIIFSRPVMQGYEVEDLLSVASEDPAFPPVIVFSDKGSADEARNYLSLGANDFWLEPLDVEKIKVVLPSVAKERTPVPATSSLGNKSTAVATFSNIVGKHQAVRRVMALARQVAPSKATVLISGESGTGKEMFARYLHAHSDRFKGPFIAVNCAALPEHLLESELFGHEKGAFTGAIARKPGKFELAHGGTILLDEISEMEFGLQAKLLRVLQESEVDRVGGTETIKVDVRVLATTNRNLSAWVDDGKFRQDLYFRLNVIPLRLPSLCERGDDIIVLAQHFIDFYIKEYALPSTGLSPEARQWLQDYNWPGNVRELQNLMERAVLISGGKPMLPQHFLLEGDSWPLFEDDFDADADDASASAPTAASAQSGGGASFSGGVIPLHEMERIMIMKGLEATSGNRTQAADLLGISVRTLRNKLSEYRSSGLIEDVEDK